MNEKVLAANTSGNFVGGAGCPGALRRWVGGVSFSGLLLGALAFASVAHAQLFTDDFTRTNDPAAITTPWTNQAGVWSITGGLLVCGTNGPGYASLNAGGGYTNTVTQAKVRFPTSGYGGGITACVAPASGARYAVWLYPDGSPGGAGSLKLIKFQTWSSFGYNGNTFVPMFSTNMGTIGTNYHTLKLTCQSNVLSVAYDGTTAFSVTDVEAQPYLGGGVGVDSYTDTTGYTMLLDDFTVTANSSTPVANADSYTNVSNTTLTIAAPGVLANDTGSSLSAVLATNTLHGTLVLSSNGGFNYTSTNNYTGTDTFAYRASNGVTNSSPAIVTITVSLNHAPVANDESYSILTNTVLTVTAPGVMANDTDSDANPLSATLLAGTLRGTLSFATNGSFTYTPTNSYSGPDSFTYRVSDGLTNSTAATVYITVSNAITLAYDAFTRGTDPAAVALPWVTNVGNWSITGGQLRGGTNPVAFGYGYAYLTNRFTNHVISANIQFQTNGYGGGIGGRLNTTNGAHYGLWLYPENSPGGGNTLKLIRFTGFGNGDSFSQLDSASIGSVGVGLHQLKIAFNGTQISGYLDGSLLVTASDATLAAGSPSADMWTDPTPYTMSLDNHTVQALALNDNYTISGGRQATIPAPGVLANDTGVNSSSLTAAVVAGPTHGVLSLSANGSFTYNPTNGYTGVETFTYQPNDGANLGVATVTLNITANNSAPNLGTVTNRTILETASLTVTNIATDSDVPANTLTYTLAVTNGLGVAVTGPVITNGIITWTPTEAQGPSTNTFTTIVTDDGSPALSDTNTFVVVVTESNLPPVFTLTPTNRTIVELTTMTVTNVATDNDLPANTLTYTLAVTNGLGVAVTNATMNNGVITWTPTELQGPSTNVFTTIVSDTNPPAINTKSFSITNTFTVVVQESNSPPVFVLTPPDRTIAPGVVLSITNSATDSDVPTNTLTYVLTNGPSGATINTNTGVISWTPSGAQDQTTNVFTTVVSDSNPLAFNSTKLSATNSFTIIVNGRPIITLATNNLAAESYVPANNAVDPGETVTFNFGLKNSGVTATTNLVVTLLETNGVTSPSAPQTYGVLATNGTIVSKPFSLVSTGACGASITVNLQLQEGPLNLGTLQLVVPTGAPGLAFSESFDSVTAPALPTGWSNAISGSVSNWITRTNGAFTAPNSAYVTNSLNLGMSELYSPVYAIGSGAATLAFRSYCDLEPGANASQGFDGGVLEIKIGTNAFGDIITLGGTFLTNGYNRTISSLYGNPLSNRPCWSGHAPGFSNVVVSLPPAASGTNVQFRFRCGTDQNNDNGAGVGWRVDSLSITGLVCVANIAPTLPAQTNRTVNESVALNVTNTATSVGSPANAITYVLTNSPPSGAQISTNGVITWTPSEAQGPGTYTLTTVAFNSGVPSLLASNSFNVTVQEVNTAPSLPAQTNYTIAELTTLSVTNTATDIDQPANSLSYSLFVTNSLGVVITNAAISTNGIITWTPTEAQGPGTYTFRTTVLDDGTPALSNSVAFTVAVLEVNTAPSLPAQINRTIAELTPLTVTNTATDGDLPPNNLVYGLAVTNGLGDVVTNASISPSGVITWTPTELQGPGTYTFTTTVIDDGTPPLGDIKTFTVAVTEANTAPSLPAQTNYTIAELTTLSVTNTATDSDLPANNLAYGLAVTNGLGDVVTNAIISTNGIITWTPTEAQGPGTYTFTTTVTDDGTPQLSDTKTFTVAVTEVNTAPSLPAQIDRTIVELTPLTVTNTATDSDLPANNLAYGLAVTNGLGAVVTNASISAAGIITWTPTEAQGPGTYTFTTTVTDDGTPPLSDTKTFTVAVTEGNSAPILPAQIDRTIAELTALAVTNTASDSDVPANNLAYGLAVTNGLGAVVTNASISPAGIITWTPTEAQGPGTYTFTTTVTDDGTPPLSDTKTFTVAVTEVNTAPSLPAQTNYTIAELTTLSVTNTASDSDLPANNLVYGLAVTNGLGDVVTNASISAAGIITWTPTEAQGPGTYTFTTTVTDDGTPPLNDTKTFTVAVTEVNSAPSLPAQTNYTIAEQTTLSVTNTASDSDLPANNLVYDLAVTNGLGDVVTNASISASGIITWTPTEAQGPGTYTFTTTVTDDGTPPLGDTKTFTVAVTEGNSAPILPAQINRTIAELTPLTVTNTATDSDLPANNLAYGLAVTNGLGDVVTNASISPSGIITWTPTEAQGPGTYTFTTTVTDDGTPPLSDTKIFTVAVTEVNTAPSLPAQTNYTIAELTLLTVTNTASDSDLPANNLVYGLAVTNGLGDVVTNASISASGIITWTPTEAQGPGTYTFTTTVTDDGTPALGDTKTFTVAVTEVNSAPSLPAQTNYTIAELSTLTVTNTASDSDLPANNLAYTLAVTNGLGDVVTNASISPSGIITWTPTEAQGPGTYTFTTTVTDDGTPALGDTKTFTVAVTEVNTAPTLAAQPDRTITVLTTLSVTNSATDNDIPANAFSYTLLSAPTNAAIVNGVISWTPTAGQTGTYTFTTQVTDDGTPPLSDSKSFTVTVNAPTNATPPEISSIILNSGSAVITWSSTVGRTYRLQYNDTLEPLSWSNSAPDILATGSTASATNSVGSADKRFFRIYLLP